MHGHSFTKNLLHITVVLSCHVNSDAFCLLPKPLSLIAIKRLQNAGSTLETKIIVTNNLTDNEFYLKEKFFLRHHQLANG